MKIRADYEVETLESKVEVQINDAIKSIDTLVGSLKDLKSALSDTINSTDNNKLKNNIYDSTKTISALKKAMNFGGIYLGLKKGWSAIKGISSDYIDMVETNNLFEVALGKVVDGYGNVDEAQSKYYNKAIAFQNEMNEKLATNRAELMNYQAMYFSMLKSQGIDLDKTYLMSENLTKAGYDIASLYNLSVEDAMSKLKSGLAGQVEPLRAIGIDISESSLQKVLNEVGIDRSVQKLSYAEKEVARYIAIVEQAQQAQGDFAKGFDRPANQIKIFKNELIELRQIAGAFVVNTFGNILVYANAIIMVIKEILKAFANLFGYDLSSGGSDLSSTVGIDNLNSGLGTASKKAKELKKELFGFDEINNISPPTESSGSGSGSSGVGGIDSKLLNNLKEWDNKMDAISSKAKDIRDKMLEWLGFVRNDDGTWRLKEGLTNFEKILDIVKAIGIAIATWKVSKTLTNILKSLGILNSVQAFRIAFGLTLALTGIYLAYKGISHILNGDIDLFTILETALGTAGGTLGIVSILKATKLGKAISLARSIQITAGLTITITSITTYFSSKNGLQDGDMTSKDILTSVGSIIGATVGTGILTKNILLTVTLLTALSMDFIATIGHEHLWYPLKKILDVDFIKDDEIRQTLKWTIDIQSFAVVIGDKITDGKFSKVVASKIKDLLKDVLLKVADTVAKWGWLGESISTAIKAGISETEKDTEQHISRSVSNSIKGAQTNINSTAEDSGMQQMLKLKQGISSTQPQLENEIKRVQNDSYIKSRSSVNSTAGTSGMQQMQSYKQAISNQQGSIEETTKNVANKANRGLNSIDTTNSGNNFLKGFVRVLSSSNPLDLFGTIGRLTKNIIKKWNTGLGEHSPSVLTKQSAIYFAQGFTDEIDRISPNMLKQISNVATDLTETFSQNVGISDTVKGIKINTKDFAIDTNQYIDYGAIRGQLQTQSNVVLNSNMANRIAEASYNAFCKAMKDEGVKIDIEARTDEGVIFKKVQSQAEDFAMQTGENPFPVLA